MHDSSVSSINSCMKRGAALGETPLPSAPRSVFDYMSSKDQERIKNIAANHSAPPTTAYTTATRGPTPPPRPSGAPLSIPYIEPHIAEAALRGFQPFTSDPTKQARYAAYLRAHAEPASGVSIPSRLQDQNHESYAVEMSEYAKAAALFRPATGAIAGRFTSAAVLELGPQIVEGLHKPATEPELQEQSPEEEPPKQEEVKDEDPKVHAARLGMYGAMTREVKPWQPARLLCKRFGVKDPDPPMEYDTPATSSTQAAEPPTQSDAVATTVPAASENDEPAGKRDLANIGLGENDGQDDDILTYERPSMDIFKAIFASDEENSDGEEDTKVDESPDADDAVIAPPIPPQTSDSSTSTKLKISEQPRRDVQEDIDMSTFKPTFIPRDPQAKAKEKELVKGKKGKKPKGTKSGILVSFELDEADGEPLSLSGPRHKDKDRDRDRPKKKRRKREEVDGDDMWVEKPPPRVVQDLPTALHPEPEVADMRSRGRKRAIDFM